MIRSENMKVTLENTIFNLYSKTIEKNNEDSKEDIWRTNIEQIKKSLEGTNFKTEEEKNRYESKLNEKIKSGAKLSPSEMSYLQRSNPIMYMRVKRVQMQREMLENKMKRCKSKKEVEEAYNQAMCSIHEKDPDKQLLASAYNNVTKEFKKTREYKSLPWDVKDKNNEKSLRRRQQQNEVFDISVKIKNKNTFDISV